VSQPGVPCQVARSISSDMKRLSTLFVLIFLLKTASFAKSPVGDWEAVQQDIPRGWQITMVTSMTFPCMFEEASQQELVCRRLDRASDDAEIHIPRERIHEIRVEKRTGANTLAGGAAGAALGSSLGLLLIPHARGASAYTFGLGGAAIGASHGRNTHILKGKVIYRRP